MRSVLGFINCILFMVVGVGAFSSGVPAGGLIAFAMGIFGFYVLFTDDNSSRKTSKRGRKTNKKRRKPRSTPRSSNSGSVYVLTNPEMPDLVKIGYTTRSAAKRAKEVSGTGVPGQWKVAHEFGVDRPKELEKRVHSRLSNRRTSSGEFFKVSPKKAAREIKRAAS